MRIQPVGLPRPSTDIKLLDDDGGEVPMGEAGEVCARGPQVMRGYWEKPEANATAFTSDGYFRTGDIGVFVRINQGSWLRCHRGALRDNESDCFACSSKLERPNRRASCCKSGPRYPRPIRHRMLLVQMRGGHGIGGVLYEPFC
jgi:hypothetical protein